jgi:hypothetical protein
MNRHAFFSINRAVASLVMGCVMAIVMLGFMWSMYEGPRTKVAVLVVAGALGLILSSMNRAQSLVSDATFMRAMFRTTRLPSTTHARRASAIRVFASWRMGSSNHRSAR